MTQYVYRVWRTHSGTNKIDRDYQPKIITETQTALSYADSEDYIIERASLSEFKRVRIEFVTEVEE